MYIYALPIMMMLNYFDFDVTYII